ncbi:MAG: hypothetical protein AB8G22_08160 [Saprospiraceae bacterium]
MTLLLSCETEHGDQRNIRKFYFPVETLDDGLVYEYESVSNDTFPPVYWYYRNIKQKDDLYLIGTAYGVDLLPSQLVTEAVVSNGMLLEDMYLFVNDTLGGQKQVPVEIQSGSAFPFLVKDSTGVFLYKVKWSMPDSPEISTTLIKNRRFLGDTTYTYAGKEYPAVIFTVKELIEQRAEGSLELEYDGVEIYAKNIGLVYYKKEIQAGFIQEYALAKTYPMTTLEAKFKQLLDDE